MKKRVNCDKLAEIDEEIGICMEKLMLLRSNTESYAVDFDKMLSALKGVEDKKIEQDVEMLTDICEIILGRNNYTVEIEMSIKYIDIKARGYGEYTDLEACMVLSTRDDSLSSDLDDQTYKGTIFFKIQNHSTSERLFFETSFEFMKVLCLVFYQEDEEREKFVDKLTQHFRGSTERIKEALLQERKRKLEEKKKIREDFETQLGSLVTLTILTYSVKQLLEKEEFRGKIEETYCLEKLRENLRKLIFPT